MARNQSLLQLRQIAFDDVQIGPAHATRQYAQQEASGLHCGARHILDVDKLSRRTNGSEEDSGFHQNEAPGEQRTPREISRGFTHSVGCRFIP